MSWTIRSPWAALLAVLTLATCGGDAGTPAATAPTAGDSTSPPTSGTTATTATTTDQGTAVTVAPSAPADTVTSSAVSDGTAPVVDPVVDSVVEELAGAAWFLGTLPATPTAADPDLPPLRLGMINQEDTDLGSYPEVRAAAQAAVAWINTELDGVDGRPVELLTCITSFDPEQSRTCARDLIAAGVLAFVGGVDVTSDGSIPEIEAAELAVFGGIPANLAEQRSDRVFAFSGGDAGALAAFLQHASETGAARVVIAYGEGVPSFDVAAREYGRAVGELLGLEVELVTYPIFTDDPSVVFGPADAVGADAVIVLAATSSCVPFMRAAAESVRRLYLTGACADTRALTAAGAAASSALFNAEGSFDDDLADASIFQAVIRRYAGEPAGGAGTVGFRGVMNLYALLLDIGAEPTTERLVELARAASSRPSFWGHPYTCDGEQVPGLPALCAPQQIVFGFDDDGRPVPVTGWIATDELLADAVR